MTSRTLVVDLSKHEAQLAPVLIGAAKAINVASYWGTGAVLLALDPGIAAHREMEDGIREAGLVVHVR
jgi:hypothetical protein